MVVTVCHPEVRRRIWLRRTGTSSRTRTSVCEYAVAHLLLPGRSFGVPQDDRVVSPRGTTGERDLASFLHRSTCFLRSFAWFDVVLHDLVPPLPHLFPTLQIHNSRPGREFVGRGH